VAMRAGRSSLARSILGLSIVPLVVLLVFVASLAWLQHQTEKEDLLTQHSDDVLAYSRMLDNDIAEAGSRARRYILLGTAATYRAFLNQIAIIPHDTRRLEASVHDSPVQYARAQNLSKEALSQVALAAAVLRTMYERGSRAAVYNSQIRSAFRHPTKESADDRFRQELIAFQNTERATRESHRLAVARMWARWDEVLFGGAIAAVGITLVLALTLGRRIVLRLRGLARQAREFARRGSVMEPVPGTDEIAAVSKTLHEMAAQVKERTALLARYKMLAENASDAMIFQRRRDRRIIDANAAAVRQYGYTYEGLLDSDERDMRADGTYAPIPETGSSGLTLESLHRRKDGSVFPVEVSMQTALIDGEEIILNVIRDLSELKAAERAIKEALDRAVEASRLKSEFVATMSHEIRTPMNGVIGATELLLDTPLSGYQREYAATARDAAHSLLGVINNILDFSKIEAGKVELDIVDFDLVAQVEGVGSMLGMQAHAKGISLMTNVDPSIPPHVVGDPTHLRQVLVNLVGNAIKFTERGGVALMVDMVSSHPDKVRVAFAVRDTGIGIDDSLLPKLFSAFTQADGSTTRKYGGTGLGLAITKHLVELMGGDIAIESYSGGGSTFSFELEFRTIDASRPRAREGVRGLRALVVDDDEMSRDILSRYLSLWGIGVETAATAEEGMAALRSAAAANEPFDVALLDLRMPKIGGLEMGQDVLGDERLRETKLLLVTAYDAFDVGREAIASGFSAYLTKPIRQSSLYDAIVESRFGASSTGGYEERSIAPAQPATSGALLLLVEDNDVNRRIAVRQLEKLGYRAECAANGQEACDRSAREHFDLIFMDCQMPVMDGFEATREIRKREGRTGMHVPIVAMTANALSGDRDECFAAGMDDYIAKPVATKELQSVLERWLHVRSAPSVIDTERIDALFDGDRAEIAAFLSELVPSTARLCERIERERDGNALRALAHELKGAAGNAGASELALHATELETMFKNGTHHSAAAVDAAVKRVLDAQSRLAATIRSGAQ